MVKHGLVSSPQKYGVYTGTKEADKKTSGKVIYNFKKIVDYLGQYYILRHVYHTKTAFIQIQKKPIKRLRGKLFLISKIMVNVMMELSFMGKYHHAICAVQLHLAHRES